MQAASRWRFLASSGPRVTVTSTVAALGTRLVWSARVVEEPSAVLVDVISVSAAQALKFGLFRSAKSLGDRQALSSLPSKSSVILRAFEVDR